MDKLNKFYKSGVVVLVQVVMMVAAMMVIIIVVSDTTSLGNRTRDRHYFGSRQCW